MVLFLPVEYSRNFLCKRLQLFTTEVVTDALPEHFRGQEPSRLDNRSLAMDPLGLNPVEPWTLDGQPARDDAYATFAGSSLLLHRLIVLAQPGSHLLTHVPGGVIPNQ